MRLVGVMTTVPEDRVAVRVHRQRYPALLYDPTEQKQIALGVLLLTEQCIGNPARGIVYSQKQGEHWAPILQPGVMAAIQL
jgi:hypothetical protein